MSTWKKPTVPQYKPKVNTGALSTSGVVYKKDPEGANPARVAVSIGGKNVTYAMLTESGGTQPMRTQFDVAMDGQTVYTLNAGKGIGSHTMTLMDGPFVCGDNAPSSILSNYPTGDLQGRKIVIVYAVNKGGSDVKATFKGLINSLSTVMTDLGDGGNIVTTTVKATGIWEGK